MQLDVNDGRLCKNILRMRVDNISKKGSGTEDEEMAVQVDLDTRGLRAKTPPGQ